MKRNVPDSSTRAGFERRRTILIGRVADALLAAGVAQIALRELASQLDTSDRMLLYYFKDKEKLVRASISEVSARLAKILDTELPGRKLSPPKMLEKVLPLFASASVSPYMMVWADISARGSREEEPFRTVARNSVQWWLEWLGSRLDIEESVRRRDLASALLTILEGARLLEASVTGSSKGAIRVLSRGLSAA